MLSSADHYKFFAPVRKALRKGASTDQEVAIIQRLPGLCNLCGAKVLPVNRISANAFSRDRLRKCIEHRIPVEKGGASETSNYQVLCFYCNKNKWQICNICPLPDCSIDCVLSFPERSTVIVPTGENIEDRIKMP